MLFCEREHRSRRRRGNPPWLPSGSRRRLSSFAGRHGGLPLRARFLLVSPDFDSAKRLYCISFSAIISSPITRTTIWREFRPIGRALSVPTLIGTDFRPRGGENHEP